MLRRVTLLAFLMLCAATAPADAQLSGGGVGASPMGASMMDCSSPAGAFSAACAGGALGSSMGASSYGQMGNSSMGGYGTEQYGTGGMGSYGAGGYPQPGVSGAQPGNDGIHTPSPTYVDQIPYGTGMYGAYRNGANPYIMRAPRKEPPTEFQRIVAGATGAELPVFGADLFSELSTTFSPIDRTPVTADYIVGPGDQLLIRVWGQVNFNAHTTVDRAGDIFIPQVGNVQVAGLHFEQLNGYLKNQLGRVYRNFDISVNMGQLRSIQVYVVGNARRPGSYTLSSLSTLVNALFSSGGPSREGSMRRIELKRGGRIVTTFDLYDLLIAGDKSKDAPLLPGDVIYIPPVGPQAAVAGSVHLPAIYELKGTETAGQAIAMAGGLASMAAQQQAQLDRSNSQGARQTIDLPLNAAGLATSLRDGDILRVPSQVQRFDNTVILRGNVANPGRYHWSPGMRVLDLIPDAQALETRGYWQRRVAMGLPAVQYVPMLSAYRASLPNPSDQASTEASASQPKGYTTNASLADAETTTQPAEQAPVPHTGTEAQPATAGGNGSSAAPGTTEDEQLRYYPPGNRFSEAQFPVKNEILRIAPSIDWSYAAIERTDPHTLATSIVPFSLGKAVLERDPAQNIALAPGDIVTVFSTADIHVPQSQQVKYVRLEGEVAHAGVYSVQPGETLRDVVARAGGLTSHAYLYGSEFLRESTQRLQQAALNNYVNTLERDIQLSAANASGSLVNATGAAALSTSLQSQRDLIASLRRIRATGRIVLNVTPYSQGVAALPDITLQDGDRFIVPVVPATVNVVGAVYDQNSFLYRRGQHFGDYLRIAGKGTRNADKHHEFVIRADGSVISKQTAGGTVFGGGFDGRLAYPGDTLVVPDNVSKTTLLRSLTDYSTVLSQFGLGIAALTILGL